MQQAAQKYVEALLVGVAGDIARTHSADGLPDELTRLGVAVDNDVRRGLLLLEKYYMITRYPDTIGGADPTRAFDEQEARRAIGCAERITTYCETRLEVERNRNVKE